MESNGFETEPPLSGRSSLSRIQEVLSVSSLVSYNRRIDRSTNSSIPEILDVNGFEVRVRGTPLCGMPNYRIKEIRVVAIK